MPHENCRVEGRITDIFFHRFVIERHDGSRILADLGPAGVEAFPITAGLDVIAQGEMKPSELKVHEIARAGAKPIKIGHKKPGPPHKPHHHGPHHEGPHHHEPADPALAKDAVARAGLDVLGEPRRKPKHFEVLARRDGAFVECHVELDGHIRKEKPVAADDAKWGDIIARAA